MNEVPPLILSALLMSLSLTGWAALAVWVWRDYRKGKDQ